MSTSVQKSLQNIDIDSSTAMSVYCNQTEGADNRLHNEMQQVVLHVIVWY